MADWIKSHPIDDTINFDEYWAQYKESNGPHVSRLDFRALMRSCGYVETWSRGQELKDADMQKSIDWINKNTILDKCECLKYWLKYKKSIAKAYSFEEFGRIMTSLEYKKIDLGSGRPAFWLPK